MSPKKLRTFLTNAQKLQLKQFWGDHPNLQLLAVVDWVRERFGVSIGRATLYRIYHAPAEAFAGNAQQKKGRRVKFPQLERDILEFYEENRRLSESSGAVLSDDALLRAAAELRARHGISESELKLSNGWLHRFKERHTLRVAPQATGNENGAVQVTDTDTRTQTEEFKGHTAKPQRKPRVPPRCKDDSKSSVQVAVAEEDAAEDAIDIQAPEQATSGSKIHVLESPVQGDGPSTFAVIAEPATTRFPTAFRPLTYITASAMDSVATVGVVQWKLNSGMAYTDHFSVESDGVLILTNATYQINVELQHSTLPTGTSSVIYKVWSGLELLGQCETSVLSEGDRTLSVVQLQCALSAQTVVRVEYLAPGAVYNGSRLVVRLLNEFK